MRRVAQLGATGVLFVVVTGQLAPQAPADPAPDTTFLLATNDPARAPSPFIDKGTLCTLVPPLGIGSSPWFMAGLSEHVKTDVPRIVAIPAPGLLGVYDGRRWIDGATPTTGRVDAYSQILDMR